jgi:serine O-acetyltransferase
VRTVAACYTHAAPGQFQPVRPNQNNRRAFFHAVAWQRGGKQPPLTTVAPLAFRGRVRDNGRVDHTVTDLTDKLVASYASVGGINHLDGKNLPSKTAIASIACGLLRLLFPGFFDERPIHSSQLKMETAVLLDETSERLGEEIYKSLDYAGQTDKKDLARISSSLTYEFLSKLPLIRELLHTDIEAAFQGDPAALSKEEVIVAYPFVEAIAVQRLAHQLYLQKVPLIPRIMTEWAHSRTGMDLHPGAQIGSHFFIDHGTGTVIGETAIIGEHVKMYQGVGLVARSLAGGQLLKGQKRHPTVEDHVTIYANATIVGGETTVGAGSTIGASVFLTQSVPPNSLVTFENCDIRVTKKKARVATDFEI